MTEVDERIAAVEAMIATPAAERDEASLLSTLRLLRQLRAETFTSVADA